MMGPLMSLCDTSMAFGVSLAKDNNPQKHVANKKMNRISSSLPQGKFRKTAVEAMAIAIKKAGDLPPACWLNVEVTERCKRDPDRAARFQAV
jgi:hypothetical protein